MAVQSTIYGYEGGNTYPSTKTIATKQHVAVWYHNEENDTWSQLNVSQYDLINNSIVLSADAISDFDGVVNLIELRVVDHPAELALAPSDIAIIVSIADEIVTVAGAAAEVVIVAGNIDNVNIVADNIDDVNTCATNIQAIIDAYGNAQAAAASATKAENEADRAEAAADDAEERGQLEVWKAEAEAMTSDSYATEPEDVNVKIYTSNGDGSFTPTDTGDYSSYHWAQKAKIAAIGLEFQGTWDASSGAYPTTRPPEGAGDPLEQGDLFIIDVDGNIDGIDYLDGDWIVYNEDTSGWYSIHRSTEWGDIINIPDNVIFAVDSRGDTMTGALSGVTPTEDGHLTRKDYVDTKEPDLGIPSEDNQMLTSDQSGNRSWVNVPVSVPDATDMAGYELGTRGRDAEDAEWSPIRTNPNLLTHDFTLEDGTSGSAVSGFTIDDDVTLTVPDGSVFTIV